MLERFDRMKVRGSLLAATVLVAAVIDLRVGLRGDLDRIPGDVMAAAAVKLRALQQPGDLIVHSPLFGIAELQALGDLRARPDLPAKKLRTRRRVLLLDRRDHPMFGFGDASDSIAFGDRLEIRVFERYSPRAASQGPRDVHVFDLTEALSTTSMRIERPPGTVSSRCDRPRHEGGYACPGEAEWLYAARRQLRIDGEETPCVWAHPTVGGVVVIEIPAQPWPRPGHKLELHYSAALVDDAVRTTADGATVNTEIVQRERIKGRLAVPNRIGWAQTKVPIEPEVPTQLRITAVRDGRRHHCINAQVLETKSAPSPPGKGPG